MLFYEIKTLIIQKFVLIKIYHQLTKNSHFESIISTLYDILNDVFNIFIYVQVKKSYNLALTFLRLDKIEIVC